MKRSGIPTAGRAGRLSRRLMSASILALALLGAAAAGWRSLPVRLWRVDRALAAGRVGEARLLLDLKASTNDPRILTRYARLRLMENRPDAVVRILADRVRSRPDPEWLAMLGESYQLLGNPDAALSAYRILLVSRPNDSQAWQARGRLAYGLGALAEAIEAYRKLEDLEPNKPEWPRVLGQIALDVDATDLAAASFRRALTLDPGNLDVRFGLAEALYLSGAVAAGLSEIDRCLESRPEDLRWETARAECLRAIGRAEESTRALDRVLARAPDDVRALRLRAEFDLEAREWVTALVLLERARAVDPGDWRVHYALSRVYGALGRTEDARQARSLMLEHQARTQLKPNPVQRPAGMSR